MNANANPYLSGWCTACGRRRGDDGRCINCDPWWTSPLIQVGGPILAVGSVFLVLLVAAVSPPKPDPSASRPTPGLSPFAAPSLTLGSSSAFQPGPLAPPTNLTAPPPAPIPQLPAAFFAPPPDPDAAMMASFEQLRYQVRFASLQMRQRNEQLASPAPRFAARTFVPLPSGPQAASSL